MGTRGGKQPGAGRPKGAQSAKTRQLIERCEAGGIMPIDVLLNDMRFFYRLGEDKMTQAKETSPGKEQAKAFRAACELKGVARDCARDAAPYVHPKLASVEAKVDVTNHELALAELK